VAVSIEGTRSYGAGLARAVIAPACSSSSARRRTESSAAANSTDRMPTSVLIAVQLDADWLTTRRTGSDREALRTLLGARSELTTTITGRAFSCDATRALKANRTQLQAIVDDLAPGLTSQRGIGPAARPSLASVNPDGVETTRRLPPWLAPTRFKPVAVRSSGTGSTGAVTGPEPRRDPHHC
jgi:hypothetical protein